MSLDVNMVQDGDRVRFSVLILSRERMRVDWIDKNGLDFAESLLYIDSQWLIFGLIKNIITVHMVAE